MANASHDQNYEATLLAVSKTDGVTPIPLEADPATGALLVSGGATGLVSAAYDAITYTATSDTVDTYKYYSGGTGGTLVATITITYTDVSHNVLVSVVRT